MTEDFSSCTHVYIRHDATREPLQPPYDGLYKAISRNDKYFTVEVKGRADTVSLDRLKPVHLEHPITATTPTVTTNVPTPPSVNPPEQSTPVVQA